MNRKKPPLKMNNVIVRSISGVVFILAMLACLMFNKFLFAGMIIFVMSVMLLEFYHITMNGSYTFSKILAILAAIFLFGILFAVSSYHIPIRFVAFAMIPVFIVMINSLYVKEKEEYGKFSNIYTGLLYIAVPIALSNLIAFDKAGNFSGNLLLCFLHYYLVLGCRGVHLRNLPGKDIPEETAAFGLSEEDLDRLLRRVGQLHPRRLPAFPVRTPSFPIDALPDSLRDHVGHRSVRGSV